MCASGAFAQQAKRITTFLEFEQTIRASKSVEQLDAVIVPLLGFAASHPNERDRALEALFEAYWPWREHSEHGERVAEVSAYVSRSLAVPVLENGRPLAEALRFLERAWQLRARGAQRMCEMALTLADTYSEAGRFRDAEASLDYVEERLRGKGQWSDPNKLALILELNLATARAALERRLGNPDGALPLMRRASIVARRNAREARKLSPRPWSDAIAAMHRKRVDLLLSLELYDAATDTAVRATEVLQADGAEADPYNVDLAQFYLAMARSWNPATSDEERQRATSRLKSYAVAGTPAQRRVARLRLADQYLAGPLVSGEQILERLGGVQDPLAESMRTRVMLSMQDVTKESLEKQLLAQRQAYDELLREWQSVPARDSGVGFLHFLYRRETIGQLVAATLRVGWGADGKPTQAAIAEALHHVMRTQVLNGLAKTLGVAVPTVPAVQQQLGKGQAVLVYLPVRGSTHCFVVTANKLAHCQLPSGALAVRGGIQRFVDRLHESCSRIGLSEAQQNELATALRAAGEDVARTVLPEALRVELEGQERVTVIGSELLHGPISGDPDAGLLNYLPIECVPWDDEWLFGERFAVDHNVSLPVWCHLLQRSQRFDEHSHLSVFGTLRRPGVPAADAERLAGKRMDAIREPFEEFRLRLDTNCTIGAVQAASKQPGQAARRIALFLAHGGYDAGSARGSFLQLHDGRLDCAKAQGLGSVDTPFADLVVLAACRAAKAPTRAGDQLANLGGAFLLAGAEAVLQSRFDLTLHSTQALLAEMMQSLAAGQSPAEAMRHARRAGKERGPLEAYRTGLLQVHGCGQLPRRD